MKTMNTILDQATELYNNGNLNAAYKLVMDNGGNISKHAFKKALRLRMKEDAHIAKMRKEADMSKKVVTKRGIMAQYKGGSDPTIWGPQFSLELKTAINEDDGREYVECYHEMRQTAEGWICIHCHEYQPSTVNTTKGYNYLDKAGHEYDELGLDDNYFWDLCVEEAQNPALKGTGFKHIYSNPDFYDTYGGLLDEVSREYMEHEKVSYIEDVNTDELDGEHMEEDDVTKGIANCEFSKDRTELEFKLLNFWGYPQEGKKDCGYTSVIWTAIRFGRKAAIDRVVKLKDELTEDEKDWLRTMLADKSIELDWFVRNLLPMKTIKSKTDNLKERMKWLEISRKYYDSHRNPDPTPTNKKEIHYVNNVIRTTYVGSYVRKDGTVVKAHYRKVTKKAVIAWTNNLKKTEKPVTTITMRFTNIKVKIADSTKYPGKKYIELHATVDGKYNVKLQHVQGCGNWICSHKNMSTETMNELIDCARNHYKNNK